MAALGGKVMVMTGSGAESGLARIAASSSMTSSPIPSRPLPRSGVARLRNQ